ncbi:MAG: glycosyltransferase family 2 protein [Pyrinomonadaceae bacterium]
MISAIDGEKISKSFMAAPESDKIYARQKSHEKQNNALDGQTESRLSKKISRVTILFNATLHIWKFQGSAALAKHLFGFLKGERRNSKIISLPNSPVKSAQTDEKTRYAQWIKKGEPDVSALNAQKKKERELECRPLISILVPVYNTDKEMLEKMIDSVLTQTYSNWELCLVDGGSTKKYIRPLINKYARKESRVKVKFLDTNAGISVNSNEALKMAEGEFIALLDHDDELAPNALYENILLLNRQPKADMVYSDEDKLDVRGLRCEPYFKPDWSPDFFCSSMYTCHLGLYRTALIRKIGGFRAEFDGAQDWDLVLRLSEETDKIYHIPKILYHWRKTQGSTALSLDTKDYAKAAQMKAVSGHFKRLKIEAEVTPGLADNLLRVKRTFSAAPKVSIVIPTRDQVKLLRTCIDSIREKSVYQNYEIIVIDNNSREPETLQYFEELSEASNLRVIKYPHQFNFAAINNFAAEYANGELLLFLNNDTEVISTDWLESMIEHAVRPEVGAVGARLLYSDKTLQHAGVIIGIGGVAGHSHKYFPDNHPGYFSRAKAIQNVSAVTAACMMVRAEVFKSLGGFNEQKLAVAFNDVDFCLRIRRANLLIIYTPYAELFHHESISRGSDQTPEKALRFQREVEYMLDYWGETLRSDPYYSPHLSLEREDFSIRESGIEK